RRRTAQGHLADAQDAGDIHDRRAGVRGRDGGVGLRSGLRLLPGRGLPVRQVAEPGDWPPVAGVSDRTLTHERKRDPAVTSENGAAAGQELPDTDEQDLDAVPGDDAAAGSEADLDVAEDTEVEQVESEDTDDEPAVAAVDENLDPAEEMRAALRHAPGDW